MTHFLDIQSRLMHALQSLMHLSIQNTDIHNYGHMSIFTKPPNDVETLSVTLYPGDVFYVPENWWHWVRSEPNTVAFNIWGTHNLSEIPKLIGEYSKFEECLTDFNKAHWLGSTSDGPKSMQVTLSKFAHLQNDIPLLPVFENFTGAVNQWHSSGIHSTPLHYDDSDNVIWVVRGKKYIDLISPKWSSKLHPIVITEKLSKFNYQWQLA